MQEKVNGQNKQKNGKKRGKKRRENYSNPSDYFRSKPSLFPSVQWKKSQAAAAALIQMTELTFHDPRVFSF